MLFEIIIERVKIEWIFNRMEMYDDVSMIYSTEILKSPM